MENKEIKNDMKSEKLIVMKIIFSKGNKMILIAFTLTTIYHDL